MFEKQEKYIIERLLESGKEYDTFSYTELFGNINGLSLDTGNALAKEIMQYKYTLTRGENNELLNVVLVLFSRVGIGDDSIIVQKVSDLPDFMLEKRLQVINEGE